MQSEGTYQIILSKFPAVTSPFIIAKKAYGNYAEDLLGFMRQQRCGYNPFFNQTCHEKDGRTMDGPYEKMTGDQQFHPYALAIRDWLLGCNPWGSSMFMNIPRGAEYPQDVHTSTWALTKKEVPGGLVDGPIYARIYNNLIGIKLNQPDEFGAFQNNHVVYHGDIGDYSTNEPTLDGTACAIILLAWFKEIP